MSVILITLDKYSGGWSGKWSRIAFWMPIGKNNGKKRRRPTPIKPNVWQRIAERIKEFKGENKWKK